LAHHNPAEVLGLRSRLEPIKWQFWHGNTDEALGLPRFAKAAGVVTYIKRNAAVIPNYGERRHYVAPIFKTARPFWSNGTLTEQ
jgi:hypothetical protein